MNRNIIIGTGIAILIIIICYAWTRDPSVTGFWSGDVEFCQTSGISSMLIYFDSPSFDWFGTSRDCYMYIGPDIAMQQFTIHHGIFNTTVEYEDDDEIWPENIKITRKQDTIYIWDSSETVLYAKLHARADLNHATSMLENDDSDDE